MPRFKQLLFRGASLSLARTLMGNKMMSTYDNFTI